MVGFNAAVSALHMARLRVGAQLRAYELQAIDLVESMEEMRAAARAQDAVRGGGGWGERVGARVRAGAWWVRVRVGE